jgi:hypothetical protein
MDRSSLARVAWFSIKSMVLRLIWDTTSLTGVDAIVDVVVVFVVVVVLAVVVVVEVLEWLSLLLAW